MRKKKLIEQIDFLEKELQSKENEVTYLKQIIKQLNLLFDSLKNSLDECEFTKVIHNNKATIVWFRNGKKVVVKKCLDDLDTVYSAVAYAIAKSIYNSNSNFKREVDKVYEK